jgi:hypothetical protein
MAKAEIGFGIEALGARWKMIYKRGCDKTEQIKHADSVENVDPMVFTGPNSCGMASSYANLRTWAMTR